MAERNWRWIRACGAWWYEPGQPSVPKLRGPLMLFRYGEGIDKLRRQAK